jgi:hypothetical protein
MCSVTHMGRISLRYRLLTLPIYGSVGVLQSGLHLVVSADNEARLAWLEGALDYAFVQRKPELWAYLEAVMDEVLFEMESSDPL